MLPRPAACEAWIHEGILGSLPQGETPHLAVGISVQRPYIRCQIRNDHRVPSRRAMIGLARIAGCRVNTAQGVKSHITHSRLLPGSSFCRVSKP
jgi:hypothetical protein